MVLASRRPRVFGVAVATAGMAIFVFCWVPLFNPEGNPRSLFPDPLQEEFFFDLVGWIGGCWLISWVSALCSWQRMARFGQWLGIILLCVNQAILIGIWRAFSATSGFPLAGAALTPLLLQLFFLGYFLGLFTLPSLTATGNRRLTGLGTLAVLLPWLLGRQAIIMGTQILCGIF